MYWFPSRCLKSLLLTLKRRIAVAALPSTSTIECACTLRPILKQNGGIKVLLNLFWSMVGPVLSRVDKAAATIAVIILAPAGSLLYGQVDVLTAQYNLDRTSSNMQETILTQANVKSSTFGKLFSRKVDASFYASPLIVTNLNLPNVGLRNVVFIATLGNSVYAFDADDPNASNPYWSVNLGKPVFTGCCFLGPTIGILSTPVIDLSTNTIYVVAKAQSTETGIGHYVFALDLRTGAFKFNSPRRLTYTFPTGVTVTDANPWIQRAGLLLYNNLLYVGTSNVLQGSTLASQEGFIVLLQANDLSVQLASFETTPTGQGGAFWQAGRGLAADSSGNVFIAADSGAYNPTVSYGIGVIKFSPGTLSPSDWFTPANWSYLYYLNLDESADGVTLLPGTTLAFTGGKAGIIYLMDQTHLGGLQTSLDGTPLQEFQASHGCGITDCAQHLPTAYWPNQTNPYMYVWDVHDYLRAYPFDLDSQRFLIDAATVGSLLPSRAGGMTISSNASAEGSGILWATTALLDPLTSAVPGSLRAYKANDITQELYDSDQNSPRDAMGTFVKMSTPIVANSRVYVNTQSNELPVYGLLCQAPIESGITISRGPFRLLPGSGVFTQQLTISNTGSTAIGAPFSIMLSGLSTGVKLTEMSGRTSCAAPTGSPYIQLAGAPLWLYPGQSYAVQLEFTLSGASGITYTPVLLAGSGSE
jgi:hypothetical protein